MKNLKRLSSLIVVTLLLTINFASANQLDDLLNQAVNDGTKESEIHKQREKDFLKDQQNQRFLVEQTKNAIDDAKTLKIKLEDQLALNEKLIVKIESEIEDKAGDLTNVFSIVHQISEDQKTALQQSVISAQFPNRLETLAKIENKNELPKLEDLKSLWLILQHQMTQSAKVSYSVNNVTDINGVENEQEVVVFGGFNAVSKDGFLSYYSPTSSLLTLAKQPEDELISDVQSWFSDKNSNMKQVVIDPSLGDILQLYLQKPTIKDRIQQAGLVGYAIIFIGIIGACVAIWRLGVLFVINKKVQKQIQNLNDVNLDNPLGQLLNVAKENNHENTELLESKLEESILSHVPQLDKGTNFIKLLAAVAPLLGLLGTVTGMIDTFQTIVDLGTSDPQSMAGGISQALLTTVFGLLAAVPLLFFHSFVTSKVRGLTVILSQQSAGLLALHIKQNDSVIDSNDQSREKSK